MMADAMQTNDNTNHSQQQQQQQQYPRSCPPEAASRLVYGKNDALFGAIEKQQGDKPFGSFLDAGTGLHSLRWMGTLTDLSDGRSMTSFTAITADETMRRNVQDEANALGLAHRGDIMIGNWFHPHAPLQLEQRYDTILADYLIGAMDGFSPYQQDCMYVSIYYIYIYIYYWLYLLLFCILFCIFTNFHDVITPIIIIIITTTILLLGCPNWPPS